MSKEAWEREDEHLQKQVDECKEERSELYDYKNKINSRLDIIETGKVDKSKFDDLKRCVSNLKISLKTERKFLPWIAMILAIIASLCTTVFVVTQMAEGADFVETPPGKIQTVGHVPRTCQIIENESADKLHCKNYCCQRLVKSAGELCHPVDGNIWTGEYRVLLHSPTCKKALEQAGRHNKTLRFFVSGDPEEIKRMMPGNVKAEVVVCYECRLIREDDGKVCKAVCCMYYGWIVEKPRTAHRQDCRLLKHRELKNLKLVCLTCCPDKATLVEKGFHLCPGCFKLGYGKPPRKKPKRRRTEERPPVLAYRLDS